MKPGSTMADGVRSAHGPGARQFVGARTWPFLQNDQIDPLLSLSWIGAEHDGRVGAIPRRPTTSTRAAPAVEICAPSFGLR